VLSPRAKIRRSPPALWSLRRAGVNRIGNSGEIQLQPCDHASKNKGQFLAAILVMPT
jgi:hypothetical protein